MYKKFQIDLREYAEQIFNLEFIEDINFEVSIGISWEFSKAITGDRETKPEPSVAENFYIDPHDYEIVEVSMKSKDFVLKVKIIELIIQYVGDQIAEDLFHADPTFFNE